MSWLPANGPFYLHLSTGRFLRNRYSLEISFLGRVHPSNVLHHAQIDPDLPLMNLPSGLSQAWDGQSRVLPPMISGLGSRSSFGIFIFADAFTSAGRHLSYVCLNPDDNLRFYTCRWWLTQKKNTLNTCTQYHYPSPEHWANGLNQFDSHWPSLVQVCILNGSNSVVHSFPPRALTEKTIRLPRLIKF